MTSPLPNEESPDFSLVLGGPIFQLFQRSHLSGNGLELLHRRMVVITLIAWRRKGMSSLALATFSHWPNWETVTPP